MFNFFETSKDKMKKFSELRNEMNGSTASIRNTSRKLA